MKRSVTIFALIGLVGCFLPFIGGISFFEFRHLEWLPIILMTGAFVVPMIAGLTGTNMGAAVAGLIGFGYIGFKFGTGLWDLAIHAEIGGKMMAVGAVGGLICSLGALVDRERA
jgi:hypothetical protein